MTGLVAQNSSSCPYLPQALQYFRKSLFVKTLFILFSCAIKKESQLINLAISNLRLFYECFLFKFIWGFHCFPFPQVFGEILWHIWGRSGLSLCYWFNIFIFHLSVYQQWYWNSWKITEIIPCVDFLMNNRVTRIIFHVKISYYIHSQKQKSN